MTAKTILDAVVDELGILRPNGYVGAADIQSRQLVALFHSVGDYLVDVENWQELTALWVLNTVPGILQYPLPPYWAGMVDETHWNHTRKLRIYGRKPEDWARFRAMNYNYTLGTYGTGVGPYMVKQIRDNYLFLQPTPTTAETLFCYYFTSAWVGHQPTSITPPPPAPPIPAQTDRLVADDDVTMWADDRLMILGVKAAWLRAKRLSYDEEYALFQDRIKTHFMANQDVETFSLDPGDPPPGSLSGAGLVVPEGNWGL